MYNEKIKSSTKQEPCITQEEKWNWYVKELGEWNIETIKTNRRKNAGEDKKIQCENCRKVHWKCQTPQDHHRKVFAVSLRRKDCCSISAENGRFLNTHIIYRILFEYIVIVSSVLAYWYLANWVWGIIPPTLKYFESQRLIQAINPGMAGSVSVSSFLSPQPLL